MNAGGLQVRETAEALEVRLHVQPRAKRCQVSGVYDGALKLKVTAPPVDDAANRAIVEFFSTLLGISRSGLQIVSGLKSKNKTLRIQGISLKTFLERVS
jgi:uncharacterized protein